MKNKTKKYKIGDIVQGTFSPMEIIEDTLPKPEELIFRGEKRKTGPKKKKPAYTQQNITQ